MKRAWALLSIVPLLAGLIPIVGWSAKIPLLVHFSVMYLSPSFNPALCFVLIGLAFLCSGSSHRAIQVLQVLLACTVVAIAAVTLAQDVLKVNLHIDLLFRKPWLETMPVALHPGRMEPNSAIAFILSGLILMFLPLAYKKILGVSIEIFIFILFLISILGISGYVLKMEFLYTWYASLPMQLSAAISFFCLSLGLTGIWRNNKWSIALYKGSEDTRIILLSSAILLCMALAVTLANFASLFKQQNDAIGQSFQQLQKSRSIFFQNEVIHPIQEMNIIRGNSLFQQEITKTNVQAEGVTFTIKNDEQAETPAVPNFAPILKLFTEEGFSAVGVFDAQNKKIASVGQFNNIAEFNVKAKTQFGFMDILWNKGWFLQIANDVSPTDKKMGVLVVEYPLKNIDKVFASNQVMGRTGDMLICMPAENDKATCYSARKNLIITLPQKVDNQNMPVQQAMGGKSGLTIVDNENNKRILVAYGPINVLGLGMLVQMEVSEIYQPIIQSLYSMVPVIVLAIFVGLLLLRLQVIPLVRRVIDAEKGLISSNKRLQESEERYALAVRGSNSGLWDWDLTHDTIFYSPYFKGMIGYSDLEFPNQIDSFKKILHPDDFDRVFDLAQQHLTNQVPFDIEYRLKRKSGDYHWFHAVGQALWNKEGDPVRMAGSLTDVTERKRSEQRLAAQYAVTRFLSEAPNLEEVAGKIMQALCERLEWEFGSFWLVDTNSNLLRCVSVWQQPLIEPQVLVEATKGLEYPMGVGMPGRAWETAQQLWAFDVATDKNFHRAEQAKTIGLHSAFCFPIMLQNKIFGVMEFLTQQRQAPDEAMLKMMAIITTQIAQFIQRKIAESGMRESEGYKTAILEAASDSIMTISEQGVIVSNNPRTSDIFDYTPAELKNKKVDALLPDLSKKLQDLAGKLAAEFIAVRKNGESFPAEITISKMYLSKQNVFVCIIRDITERKKIEKLKNEFVSVVSHELRTPLTSIRGSLGLILGGTVGSFSEKAYKLLDIANNNCERLLLLINDILDIEKIEAGKMDFQLEPTDAMDLVNDAIDANRMYAEKYGVRIHFANPQPGYIVNVDPARMMQVLSNLISNAVKFSPPNGTVDLSVDRHADIVRIAVTDYGSGVPEKFRMNIFQKFSQADSSAARGKGGTGLGLSISKAIVEKFGGTMGFTSKPGVETVFYFNLPSWNAEMNVPQMPELPELTLDSGAKILICEDDEDHANYVQLLLKAAGYNSDVAYTVKQAKTLLAERQYQALLLDLLLPDQDGITFIRELRDDEKNRFLPVIVLSVMAQAGQTLINGDAFSVVDWLDKPVDFNKLLKAIDRLKKHAQHKMPRVLHVEDNPDTRQIIATLLQDHAVITDAESLEHAQAKLAHEDFDLVILDLLLPDGNGAELLPFLAKRRIPVIVFSSVELDREYSKYVKQALIKAETSNEYLIETIKELIHKSV